MCASTSTWSFSLATLQQVVVPRDARSFARAPFLPTFSLTRCTGEWVQRLLSTRIHVSSSTSAGRVRLQLRFALVTPQCEFPPDTNVCPVCADEAKLSCSGCDEAFCHRHVYQCDDCSAQLCGGCLDSHLADGHWCDSDTASSLYHHTIIRLESNSPHLTAAASRLASPVPIARQQHCADHRSHSWQSLSHLLKQALFLLFPTSTSAVHP